MSDFNDSGRMRFDTPADAIEYHVSQAEEESSEEDVRFHLRHIRQYLEEL